MTFFLAIAHGMEKFRWQSLIGGLIALLGIALAVRAQVGVDAPVLSVVALIAGPAIASEGNIIMKLFSPRSDPLATNALTMSAGMALLLVLTFVVREPHVIPALPATWVAIAYSVIPGSVMTFYMFVWLLGKWSASATHYVVMLFPIVATIAGALLAGERITPTFILGGTLVLAGVWVGALMRPTR
jgi:drug/metabolite transporter (DMT)-like permease